MVREKTTGRLQVVPTGGQVGYRLKVVTPGAWTTYDTILAAGDLTGDGKGDLVVRDRRTGAASVLPGNGKGGFKAAVGKTASYAGYRWFTAVGDFNRDGKADLVVRDDRSRALLLPGTGKGTFGKPVVLSAAWTFHRAYGAGDFNGDGNPDLFARSADGRLWFLPGQRTPHRRRDRAAGVDDGHQRDRGRGRPHR